MKISLRQQIFLWYALVMPLIIVGLAFAAQQVIIEGLHSAIDSRLHERARIVASIIISSPAARGQAYEHLIDWITEHRLYYIPAVLRVSDPQGNILASFGDIPDPLVPLMDAELLLPALEEGHFKTIRKRGYDALRLYTIPVPSPSTGETIAFVQTGNSLVAISEAQRGLWQHTLAVGFVGSAVALASGFVILNRGFRPLDRMINLLRQVRGQDLTIRLPEEPRPQELQYLADTLNTMMQRLHTTFTTREIFFAGVSHDLRTPLSLLQGQIDLLLMQPSLDPGTRERLNSMSKEVRRLSRITNNLLLSARLEAAPIFIPGEVDLKELVEEVVRETRLLSQGLHFNVSIPEIIGIFADYDLLKQMLLNVVDNAIKFTPRGGSVTLGLREVGQWAAITISDTGQGIPREKITRLTEPFHRACTDQNPRKQGAGLGLAIVKQIINLHSGELEIQSEEGIGTTVTIRLPLS